MIYWDSSTSGAGKDTGTNLSGTPRKPMPLPLLDTCMHHKQTRSNFLISQAKPPWPTDELTTRHHRRMQLQVIIQVQCPHIYKQCCTWFESGTCNRTNRSDNPSMMLNLTRVGYEGPYNYDYTSGLQVTKHLGNLRWVGSDQTSMNI